MSAPAKRRYKGYKHAKDICPRLVREQNYRCFWCGTYIYAAKLVPGRVLADGANHESQRWIYYRDRVTNEIVKVRKATVDHVVERSRGGSNKRTNLVAACDSCNSSRSNNGPFGPCLWCGTAKRGVGWLCFRCNCEDGIRDWLLGNGWDFWPNEDRGMWQHPFTKHLHTWPNAVKRQGQRQSRGY